MNRRVREQNAAEELRHREEQERAERELNAEDIELSDDFFRFDLDNIGNSAMQEYTDEDILVQWHALKVDVDNFFRRIITPTVIVAPVAAPRGNAVNVQNVQQGYINQLDNDDELSRLHQRSLQLGMDQASVVAGERVSLFDEPQNNVFGVFRRLDDLVNARNQVLKDFIWCQSRLQKYLWKTIQLIPKVEKGDACINYLTRSINKLISTGCFLRKYRRDCDIQSECAEEEQNVTRGMIIDFRVEAQRTDYLNIRCSEFVDPELELAERYLQAKILAKENELQQRARQELVNARRLPGGRISRRRGKRNGIKSKSIYN